jgi:hypothetical protein
MLELRTAERDERVEATWTGRPEAPKVERRMSLPVPDVALLAGRGHEDRTEAVRDGESTRELLVTGDVLAHLRGRHALDRPIEKLILRRAIRRQDAAPRQGEGDQQEARIAEHGHRF